MKRMIIRQLWNNRRKNGWLLAELVLVTYFLWGVIDPIYVLLSNKYIDEGYETKGVYCLMIGEYPSSHSAYKRDQDVDSLKRQNFLRIFDEVRHYPNVETAVITLNQAFPHSSSYTGSMIHYDTLSFQTQIMEYYDGGDFFGTFRITNHGVESRQTSENSVLKSLFITEDVAKKLFNTIEEAAGKSVWVNDSTRMFSIVEVLGSFKSRSIEQPKSVVFIPTDKLKFESMPYSAQICFRAVDGISEKPFIEKFKKEMSSRLEKGNFYFINLKDFDVMRADNEYMTGTTNTLRLQLALVMFFLFCTFLGIIGAFWLRSNARRGEIGLRMALGSTRRNIHFQFLFEAWILTTIGCLLGLIIVVQRVYHDGFAFPTEGGSLDLLQNQPFPHFTVVSMVVYLLLMLTATIGTWIPASRAASVNPTEALGDE